MIIFLYGADTFRSRRFRQELQDKFKRDVDPGAISLGLINGQSASLPDIANQLGSGSLFVKKRLVIIEDIFKNKKEKIFTELTDYLKKINEKKTDDENVILFHDEEIGPLKTGQKKLMSFLLKQPYTQEFKPLNKNQIASFIKNEAKLYKKQIFLPAAKELSERTGEDLWLISRTIKKLSFSTSEPEITIATIRDMVPGSYDENIFSLTDALSAKNKKLAALKLEEQYQAGLSDEYILSMLIRQFKILLQIKSGLEAKLSASDLTARLKLHPFVIKKGAEQAKNFELPALKSYLNQLINLDKKNKTGPSDVKTELALLISHL